MKYDRIPCSLHPNYKLYKTEKILQKIFKVVEHFVLYGP